MHIAYNKKKCLPVAFFPAIERSQYIIYHAYIPAGNQSFAPFVLNKNHPAACPLP